MEVWQWVLAYAILLVVVQVFVYLYLRGDDGERSFDLSDEGERGRGTPQSATASQPYTSHSQQPGNADSPGSRPEVHHAVVPAEEAVVCRHCGARNEREGGYTYCRSCTSQLGM